MAASGPWQRALLRAIGAPATASNIKFLNAWQRAEGGGASFNPLNTTQHYAGASNFNTIGVKNYPSFEAGIQATAQTLLNGRYNSIVTGLRSGNMAPMRLAQAEAATPWGTGQGIMKVLGGPVSSYGAPYAGAPAAPTPGETHAQTQNPAELTHNYSNFAMSLIAALQHHDPMAMYGAIVNLRKSLAKPQPVSMPHGSTVGGPPGVSGPVGTPTATGGTALSDLIRAEKIAKAMGLRASENYNLPGGVNPVHVKNSYHYRKFPGTNIGEAIDVSGSPQAMAAYFRKMLALGGTSELFYDPLGGYKYGKSIGPIGGHRTHVHVAY